jgi:hypothetical protein
LSDVSWVTERNNAWDAIGVASYGLVFVFLESVIIFLFLLFLGFLVSKKWASEKRLVILSTLLLIASLWAMLDQIFYIRGGSLPEPYMDFLLNSEHPLRVLYGVTLALVFPSISIPTYLIIKKDHLANTLYRFIDRLALLSSLYIFFDFLGLIIVVYRNL